MQMVNPSAQTIWTLKENELLRLMGLSRNYVTPLQVYFYEPRFMLYEGKQFTSLAGSFPTISITGNNCSLNCKHCEGKILQTMYPLTKPEQLLSLCTKLNKEGALGCLISGGCLSNGSVPLAEFLPAIAEIKHNSDLMIFTHTGIIDLANAKALKNAGVDAALIDIIGDDQTIHQIYNLNLKTQNFEASLKALHEAQIAFIPHVIVGLDNGKLKGEFSALKMIAKYNPSAVVIIAFIPIPGTAMAKNSPPSAIDVARTIAVARVMLPKTPIVLGCMRPKGKIRRETELLALKAGIDAITYPSNSTIQYAKNQKYNIKFSRVCCANIYKDLLENNESTC